jgi:hypothetical protein
MILKKKTSFCHILKSFHLFNSSVLYLLQQHGACPTAPYLLQEHKACCNCMVPIATAARCLLQHHGACCNSTVPAAKALCVVCCNSTVHATTAQLQ